MEVKRSRVLLTSLRKESLKSMVETGVEQKKSEKEMGNVNANDRERERGGGERKEKKKRKFFFLSFLPQITETFARP